MINLRYHIVSIIAVFLALAIGVVMGSTVIARSELDLLHNRQNDLEKRSNDANKRNAAAQEGERRAAASSRTRPRAPSSPETSPACRWCSSVCEASSRARRTSCAASWPTPGPSPRERSGSTRKLRLDNQGDVQSLATALGVPAGSAAETRTQALNVLADVVAGRSGDLSALASLRDAGFIEIEPPATATTTTTSATGQPALASSSDTRVVVMSGAGAELSDDEVAIPLVRGLAAIKPGVIAVEAGTDQPGGARCSWDRCDATVS